MRTNHSGDCEAQGMTMTLILRDSEHHHGLSIRAGAYGSQVQPTWVHWVYLLAQVICLDLTFIIGMPMFGSGQNIFVPWHMEYDPTVSV